MAQFHRFQLIRWSKFEIAVQFERSGIPRSRIVRRNGTILEVSLALKDPVLEVTHGIGYFLKSGLALKNVFICVAEIRVLLVADKLHRSSVETIAAYMLLAPTYDLHVVQFYESVVR